MKKKSGLLSLILVMLVMAIALGGCQGDKKNSSSTDSITIGIPQDLEDTLDPHKVNAAGTKEVLFNVYEGLVKYDSEGNLNPALASGYDISEDGLTYTFTLRENVLFHDGTPVTAADVIYSINRCAGADGEDPLVPAFSNISSIKEEGGKVIITLKAADSDFLAYMTTAIIPESNKTPESTVIGTGPYKFISRTPQESVELVSFDDYWGEKAHIKNVNLKVCANADAIVMELLGGTVDLYPRITADQMNQLEGSEFDVLEGTMNLVQALYINNSCEPFDDPNVRKALCYAIDPNEIMLYVSDGRGTEIGSSMFPAFGKYYDEALNDTYNTDIDKAKELLAEAGYPNGFEFTVTVPSNYQQHIDTAEVLKQQLEKVGVTANIELVEWETWVNDIYVGRQFETTVVGVDASTLTARALLERFTTGNDKNFINYSSNAYDEAFANAIATTDDEKQTQYYKECLQILSDDAANVYIQDLPTFVAVKNTIGGYEFYPLYVQDYSKLYYK